MQIFVSPGVYVTERDFSDYAASISTTSLGLVGTAKRGPLNIPTFIPSASQFIDMFGEPDANQYGPYAALNYLRQGNQLWYCRVAREYQEDAGMFTTTVAGSVVPAADGKTYSFEVAAGYTFAVDDYLRITEDGKATTQGARVTAITDHGSSGSVVTINIPLNDSYTINANIASSVEMIAAGKGEVWGLSRSGGAVTRLVQFTAADPGKWSNFGTSQGVEIVIEDGGQFSNLNPSTNLPIESPEGIPLQGVSPSAPSVDTVNDLYQLGSNDGVRVGQLRGVNFALPTYKVKAALAVSSKAAFVIEGEMALTAVEGGDVVIINGTGHVVDGTNATVFSVEDGALHGFAGDTVVVTTSTNISGLPTNDLTGATMGDTEAATRNALVFRCTSTLASTSKWTPAGLLTKRVRILYQGRLVETYDNLRVDDATSDSHWDNAFKDSNYIRAAYFGTGEQPINSYNRTKNPNNPRLTMGYNTTVRTSDSAAASLAVLLNAAGHDGDSPGEAEYIGTVSTGQEYTGIQHFRRTTNYDINILAVPGVSLPSVILEMISVVTQRADCMAIVDPPLGLTLQECVDWHNGTGPYTGEHSAFVSNRAALYYPHVQQFDPYTGRDLWLPPSCVIPAVYAYSDRVGETWYAPAGVVRGQVQNARKVERQLEQGELDLMYGPGNGNAINPIMQFNTDGIVVYGNRTLQRTPTKLASINVRRMLFYVEKIVATSVRRLVFDQNDEVLWSQVRNIIDPLLATMEGRRALEWYKVKCDIDTNPAINRNNGQCGVKVYVIPTGSAEKIGIDFTLLASGANVEEFIALDNQ